MDGFWFHRISWFKDGQSYPWKNFGSSLPILFARNQSLVIVSMSPQDEGHYKCVATDGSDVSKSCLIQFCPELTNSKLFLYHLGY